MYSYPTGGSTTNLAMAAGVNQATSAPGFYGGSGSYAPGSFSVPALVPQMMPQQQMSYSPPAMPQAGYQSPRATFGAFGQGGGSGRFTVGPLQGAATPTWNQAPAITSMSGGSYTAAPGGPGPGALGMSTLAGSIPQMDARNLSGNRGSNTSVEGLPTPPQITAQQQRYAAALDQQLAVGIATLEKERDLEKQMLKFTCEKDIALFTNAATENYVEKAELVDEKMTFAILELKKAAVERKLQLDAQANGLTLDYQMKVVQVEWQKKWNAFEVQYANAEKPLEAEFAAQEAIAHSGTAYAGPTPVLR